MQHRLVYPLRKLKEHFSGGFLQPGPDTAVAT